jgi:hypothetical protein
LRTWWKPDLLSFVSPGKALSHRHAGWPDCILSLHPCMVDQAVQHDLMPTPLQSVPQFEIAFGGMVIRIGYLFTLLLFEGQHVEAG